MSVWLILSPLACAALGWFLTWVLLQRLFRPYQPVKLFGISFQGIIPKRKPEIAFRIGDLVKNEFAFSQMLEEKILGGDTLEKITPEIERHIDHFLRVKLKEAMPMVGSLIGDRTISQLKEIFMTEMKELFPEVMKGYVKEIQKDFNLAEKISQKFETLTPGKIEAFIVKAFSSELCYIQLAGATIGFVVGATQLIIILMVLR